MSCPYCAVGGNGHSAQCPVWQQSQQAQAAQQFHTGLGGLYLPLPPYPLPIPLPSSPLPAPDHPELLDLISYRVWLLSPAGFLKSTARHFTWLPGEIIEGNPSLNHNGIHSYKTIQGALDHTITPPQVIGSILSWGEVIEHENGYRSQFAKINSLDYIILPGVSPWDLQNEVALRWLRHKYLLPEEASNEP